jgi:acetyl-CoA synthetase
VPPSIGLSNMLLNKDHHEVYYADTPPGPNGELLRRHGDEMEVLPEGFYRAHGRADDTMNLGGIKVSSAEIERTLASVDGVVETAAVAFNPPDGGPSLLVVYAVMLTDSSLSGEPLKKEMQRAVASKLNPLFKIHEVVPVEALPRTASNKVMRRVLRDQYGNGAQPRNLTDYRLVLHLCCRLSAADGPVPGLAGAQDPVNDAEPGFVGDDVGWAHPRPDRGRGFT